MAFWASRAGAQVTIAKLAVRPDAQTGKFSKKFDSVVGTKPSDVPAYGVATVRRPRASATRTFEPSPLLLPHEAIGEELGNSPVALSELRQAIEDDELPPFYTEGMQGRPLIFIRRPCIWTELPSNVRTEFLAYGSTCCSPPPGTSSVSSAARNFAPAGAKGGVRYFRSFRQSPGRLRPWLAAHTPNGAMMGLSGAMATAIDNRGLANLWGGGQCVSWLKATGLNTVTPWASPAGQMQCPRVHSVLGPGTTGSTLQVYQQLASATLRKQLATTRRHATYVSTTSTWPTICSCRYGTCWHSRSRHRGHLEAECCNATWQCLVSRRTIVLSPQRLCLTSHCSNPPRRPSEHVFGEHAGTRLPADAIPSSAATLDWTSSGSGLMFCTHSH